MDVVSYITDLLVEAIGNRASDIHIEPQADCLRIRQRIDGFLIQTDEIPLEFTSAVLSRIKIMGHLDIGERRIPQDGAMTLTQEGVHYDVRISTLPTLHGEKIVLRMFRNQFEPITLDQLGIEQEECEQLERLIRQESGLLIVTGPTGSGKTTTLYAILQRLNHEHLNIVTLEDPIELQIPGVNQVQIHPKAGLTFSTGLRAVLRQDPNVIMIGEIRDSETAEIAIGAALTGHLVLSTLHTADCASAVMRLLDMKMEPYRVAAALRGVIAQRLIRLKCIHCLGQKCVHCQHTGYLGRTGVFEMVVTCEQFQQLIMETASLASMRQLFRKQGISSLREAALKKVHQGITNMEEYYRVVDYVEELE
ncbi:general secretion pathway protein E/type IV pilus assembly protein PilB [Thermoflavimicrobium dichotomicum]|uniref:General secretion pathway protein E/type IV pilus assembly protein PilB n=1 Tax=Thermoflavimicrobium dichotomicum TaxID=46223 RepID=A0A1I3NDT1_9BACL|nr:general secretion pathway protein E/type IV pilus assembly protein PilB [Thermoflavimicrobium dichotomicum]